MNLVTKENVNFNLNTTTKEETLKELASMAFKLGKVSDSDTFFKALCERETESTTGFGNGIAIPHARHTCVKEAGILFVRCSNDIEWESLDGDPVNVCVCLIAPDDQNDFHLKTLSKFARKLMHEDFVDVLKNASEEDVLKSINEVIA